MKKDTGIIKGIFASTKEAKNYFKKLQERAFEIAIGSGDTVNASESHLSVGDINCVITNDTVKFVYNNMKDRVQRMSSLVTILSLQLEPNVVISGLEV